MTGSTALRAWSLTRHDSTTSRVRAPEAAAEWTTGLDERSIRPDTTGPRLVELFADTLPETGLGEDAFVFDDLLQNSRAQNRRFFGYVMGSAEPVGVLGEFLSAALNQNVTSWRSGPAATTIERALVDRFAYELGCDGFWGASAAAVPPGTSWDWRWLANRSPRERARRPARDRLRLE